jgi:hypothetical protein
MTNTIGKRPRGALRSCHNCGATRTYRGFELTGNYCSPKCLNEARSRRDPHGITEAGRGKMETGFGDSYEDYRDTYNPFKDLFDE